MAALTSHDRDTDPRLPHACCGATHRLERVHCTLVQHIQDISFDLGLPVWICALSYLSGEVVNDLLLWVRKAEDEDERKANARLHAAMDDTALIAVGETAILLHPPLPVVGVSIGMERECQQIDSLADG